MQLLIYKQFVLDVCPTVTVIDVSLTHREESQLTDTQTHTYTPTNCQMCEAMSVTVITFLCDHFYLREETDMSSPHQPFFLLVLDLMLF